MHNPILAEVFRGPSVESRHRGALAICDGDGTLILGLGDVSCPVYPRSAIKAFQTLPLVESGAAGLFGLLPSQIALCCASHSGEPPHAAAAAAILAKAGKNIDALECGAHWPMENNVARALAATGAQPSSLHNNCSGKHAGFVCLACAMDVDSQGYIHPTHPVQREVRGAIEDMIETPLNDHLMGVDGCSIPSFSMPLHALAHGFAKFSTGNGLGAERAKAAATIRAAIAANPYMVAGTGRFDTQVMQILGARAFIKMGAEGVYCAALPEQGIGIALKCDDGALRAAEIIIGALLQRYLPMSEEESLALTSSFSPILKNWNGMDVGAIKPAAILR